MNIEDGLADTAQGIVDYLGTHEVKEIPGDLAAWFDQVGDGAA